MTPTITHEDWLSALLAAQAKNDSGLTAGEWAERMKCSHKTALTYIKKAHAQGWVVVGKRSGYTLDGRQCYAPVYTIKKPGGKK